MEKWLEVISLKGGKELQKKVTSHQNSKRTKRAKHFLCSPAEKNSSESTFNLSIKSNTLKAFYIPSLHFSFFLGIYLISFRS